MPTVNVTHDYVYFASGPHSRQPRAPAGPGGFTLIQTLPGGTQTTGNTFVAGQQPPTQIVGGATYTFAFVNVSGGTPVGQTIPGGVNSFQSNVPAPPVIVDSAPIVVLVVYVPTGGGTGPGLGATIDSFNETTGLLFNDTFVTVSPDPGGPPPPLAHTGNVEGYVDTTNTETIKALSPTSPTGVDFDEWVLLGVPQGVIPTGIALAGTSLTVDGTKSISALAFYRAPPPPPPLPPAEVACDDTVNSLQQMINIGVPGPLFTVAEWAAVQANLKKCVAEGYLTEARMNQLIAGYLAYAKNKNPGPPKPQPLR